MSEDPSPSANAAEIADLIRSRRTIHLFEKDVPPRRFIVRAIELARWAPNHHLTEPWRFYLLGPETAQAIAHLNADLVTTRRGPQVGDAKRARWLGIPGWLAVTSQRSSDPIRDRENYAACACAIQNLQLYLWSEGIGMKWTTGDVTREPQFFDLLGIDPDEEQLVGLMWYGYPADVPQTERRPVDDVVYERP